MTTFYCHKFEIPPTWSPGFRIYIPQEKGGPVIPPAMVSHSVPFYDSLGYGGGNSNPPAQPVEGQSAKFKPRIFPVFRFALSNVKVKVTVRLTVSQSVCLAVEPHLRLMTRYLLLFDSYGLVFVGRLL
jgi:hypothetical protein